MGVQLVLGTIVIIVTAVFHVLCLVMLAGLLRWFSLKPFVISGWMHTVGMLAVALLFIIGIHTVEAWTWAAIYLSLGEFPALPDALYFSVVTLTTLGYGDLTLSPQWQILGTFEAMGGLILFGASTAFLLGLMRKLLEPID